MSATDETAVLTSVRDLVRWGASRFASAGLVFGHGTDNALDEAYHLVLHALHLPADLPAVYLEAHVTDSERGAALDLMRERIATRKPAAYLLGHIEFCGLDFAVDESVLIPRSPIGEMIANGFRPWLSGAPGRILDLCSGSGCIGIAAALRFPEAEVDLAELDEKALALSRRNIARHDVEDRVRARKSDLFSALNGQRYQLIVCNPPYVPTAEWESLPAEYHHEPRMALEAGVDGMDLVDRILMSAADHLRSEGLLVCEIGGSREEFEARFPRIPVVWPEFERGGDGVFLISRDELRDWRR